MIKTRCNKCNEETTNMNPGNVCHSCQRGIMVAIEEESSLFWAPSPFIGKKPLKDDDYEES